MHARMLSNCGRHSPAHLEAAKVDCFEHLQLGPLHIEAPQIHAANPEPAQSQQPCQREARMRSTSVLSGSLCPPTATLAPPSCKHPPAPTVHALLPLQPAPIPATILPPRQGSHLSSRNWKGTQGTSGSVSGFKSL